MTICDRCYQPIDRGEHGLGLCPLEPRSFAPTIWPDDIPGGTEIAHGLCDANGQPVRFDSRSAIRRAAAHKGLVPWTDVYTEDRTKDARVYADWQRSGEAARQRDERREMRRAGIRPESAPVPMKSNPEQRARIKKLVAEYVRGRA